jgi:translation initiation factor 5
MSVNIPKSIKDSHYRYKRPELKLTYHTHIRTILENIHEVSKAIIIPPEYPLKFIGYELGSQTEIKGNEYTISGKHPLDKLEDCLEKFISKYVICSSKGCKLPEVNIFIKNNEIRGKCKACSHIAALDNKHKMATYIIKNPPKIDAKLKNREIKTDGKPTKSKTGAQTTEFVPDFKAVKQMVKKVTEEVSKNDKDSIEALLKNYSTDKNLSLSNPDCRFFILFHGIYSKDIYQEFEKKSGYMKFVSCFLIFN